MRKNDILKALDNLGFTTDEVIENHFHFEYEDEHFLYTYYDDDDVFLHLSIPGIFQIEEKNADDIMPVLNRTNRLVKYVKFIYSDDMVWTTLEYPIFDGVNIEEILKFSILILHHSAYTFNNVLCGDYNENSREEEEGS